MKNLQAFFVMTIWTAFSVCILYLLDAHINYREIAWAISISISFLMNCYNQRIAIKEK